MPSPHSAPEIRVVSAMAHPLRARILDLLVVEGPATVSGLATALKDSPGNVSHHVKVMAEAGLVVPAPELARDRRERWWRPAERDGGWSEEAASDVAAQVVLEAAGALALDHQVRHVRNWAAAPGEVRSRWPSGPFSTSSWLVLSDAELATVQDELAAVLRRWSRRDVPDDGADRTSCFLFAHGVPARP